MAKTVLLRNFGLHFFLHSYRPVIRRRILDAVLAMQEDVDVIGLGALVKDERITQGGRLVVEELGDRLKTPVIHGDTLTAAVVAQQVLNLYQGHNLKSPIFMTGATSKIGRAVALYLAQQGYKVKMYTKDKNRFNAISVEAGPNSNNLIHVNVLSEGRDCNLWITGKAIPSGKELSEYIPGGSIVLNFAVPNPLSAKDLKKRKDLNSHEGGLLAYNPNQTNLTFTMRLKPGLTYACHAATFVHANMGWQHHEVGPVKLEDMDYLWKLAQEVGFFLPRRCSDRDPYFVVK